MIVYALDANAIVTLLEDRPGAEQVERILLQRREGAECVMSAFNWAEAYSTLGRRMSSLDLQSRLNPLRHNIDIVGIDVEMAEQAAQIKNAHHLGYGDAFAAALAMREKATLVTADPEFAKLGKQIKLKMLPSHKRKN